MRAERVGNGVNTAMSYALRMGTVRTAMGTVRTVHQRRAMGYVPSWATVDPWVMSAATPAVGKNLVGGVWSSAAMQDTVIDPLNGEGFVKVPDTSMAEIGPYVERMAGCPRSGLHNPLKNPERYTMLGEVMVKGAAELGKPEVIEFFTKLIQRLVPKSTPQCRGEPVVTRKWMENYGSDQVRYLARSFGIPGDFTGQTSTGIRMPFGGVAVITPFNFPLEICALQTCSALFMGNQPLCKVDSKVAIVMEQFIRMLHHVGLPKTDIDFIYCDGPVMNEIVVQGDCKMCLFTGSQRVAEKLAIDLRGKVKLEDAGFDWKILGPDPSEIDYVVWQSDQDAYAASGQKCSAQSMLIAHDHWMKLDVVGKLGAQAAKRSFADLTIGPVITWTTEKMEAHFKACLALPGAYLAFGGKRLTGHTIPKCYGAVEPTAVYVPLESILASDESFKTATKELFGPFQVSHTPDLTTPGPTVSDSTIPVGPCILPTSSGPHLTLTQVITSYSDKQLPLVLELVNRMENHLTAGVVSNDPHFLHEVLSNTISGTTYAGIRARTTGAPQQHWFGPSGDPRSAGIHTPEAIKLCWSSHREIIYDYGPVVKSWQGKQS